MLEDYQYSLDVLVLAFIRKKRLILPLSVSRVPKADRSRGFVVVVVPTQFC